MLSVLKDALFVCRRCRGSEVCLRIAWLVSVLDISFGTFLHLKDDGTSFHDLVNDVSGIPSNGLLCSIVLCNINSNI